MTTRHFFQAALLTLALLIAGCAQKTAILVKKPAEIDVGGINRIAILDFRGPGNSGGSAASIFISKLFKSEFYTIVERAELQSVLEEHALNMSGVIDVETAVEAGNLLGVQGVIMGEVINYHCEDRRGYKKEKQQVWTGEYEKDKDGNIIYEKTLFGIKVKKKKYKEELVDVEVIDREATVSLSFRLIDVETGQIRASRETSHSYNKSIESGNQSLPPRHEILTTLCQQGIDDFVRMLAPHTITIQTEFAGGNDRVDKGIEFAKNGLWDKARDIWQSVVDDDPGDHAAWYNLGLALEAQAQFEQAEKAYDRAVTIKPDKLYIQGLKRIRTAIEDNRRLQKQIKRQQETAEEEEI